MRRSTFGGNTELHSILRPKAPVARILLHRLFFFFERHGDTSPKLCSRGRKGASGPPETMYVLPLSWKAASTMTFPHFDRGSYVEEAPRTFF